VKTKKFENFLENILKGRFLLEDDGKNTITIIFWGGGVLLLMKYSKCCRKMFK
jgi:hypothetical protein